MMHLKPLPCEASAALTPAPALPNVAPLRLAAAPRGKLDKEKAEREREEAWWFVPRWRGVVLRPYSIGRDELWRRMLAVAVPGGGWSSRMEAGHLLRLLFLCAVDPADLIGREPVELVEAAESWTDDNVSRGETAAALALVRQMLRHVAVVRARPRPAERRGDKENVAVPVLVASYAVLVAEAMPTMPMEEIEWRLPLVRGWSLIHAHWIAAGVPTLWQDQAGSKAARWLQAWRQRHGL